MFGGKLNVGAPEDDFGGGHALPSFGPDGKRIQFGIGILTKRICYYPLLLVNRYFLTNDYYSPISTRPVVFRGLSFDTETRNNRDRDRQLFDL